MLHQPGRPQVQGPGVEVASRAAPVGIGIIGGAGTAAFGDGSVHRSGAPRSMNMGTTRSPFLYDIGASIPPIAETARARDFVPRSAACPSCEIAEPSGYSFDSCGADLISDRRSIAVAKSAPSGVRLVRPPIVLMEASMLTL